MMTTKRKTFLAQGAEVEERRLREEKGEEWELVIEGIVELRFWANSRGTLSLPSYLSEPL